MGSEYESQSKGSNLACLSEKCSYIRSRYIAKAKTIANLNSKEIGFFLDVRLEFQEGKKIRNTIIK